MSKGSKQRPRQVSFDEYADNWDKVFKQKADEKKMVPVLLPSREAARTAIYEYAAAVLQAAE